METLIIIAIVYIIVAIIGAFGLRHWLCAWISYFKKEKQLLMPFLQVFLISFLTTWLLLPIIFTILSFIILPIVVAASLTKKQQEKIITEFNIDNYINNCLGKNIFDIERVEGIYPVTDQRGIIEYMLIEPIPNSIKESCEYDNEKKFYYRKEARQAGAADK